MSLDFLSVVCGEGMGANCVQGNWMILVWWLGLLRRVRGDGASGLRGGLEGRVRPATTSLMATGQTGQGRISKRSSNSDEEI